MLLRTSASKTILYLWWCYVDSSVLVLVVQFIWYVRSWVRKLENYEAGMTGSPLLSYSIDKKYPKIFFFWICLQSLINPMKIWEKLRFWGSTRSRKTTSRLWALWRITKVLNKGPYLDSSLCASTDLSWLDFRKIEYFVFAWTSMIKRWYWMSQMAGIGDEKNQNHGVHRIIFNLV